MNFFEKKIVLKFSLNFLISGLKKMQNKVARKKNLLHSSVFALTDIVLLHLLNANAC